MNKIATVMGYTKQARFYAASMAVVTADPDSDWKQAGWTKLANGAVKPVFELKAGTKVVILDGANHLTVVVYEVPAEDIKLTEEECW